MQPSKLDRALTELHRVRSGHRNILPETTSVASGSMSAQPGEAHLGPLGVKMCLWPVSATDAYPSLDDIDGLRAHIAAQNQMMFLRSDGS